MQDGGGVNQLVAIEGGPQVRQGMLQVDEDGEDGNTPAMVAAMSRQQPQAHESFAQDVDGMPIMPVNDNTMPDGEQDQAEVAPSGDQLNSADQQQQQ